MKYLNTLQMTGYVRREEKAGLDLLLFLNRLLQRYAGLKLGNKDHAAINKVISCMKAQHLCVANDISFLETSFADVIGNTDGNITTSDNVPIITIGGANVIHSSNKTTRLQDFAYDSTPESTDYYIAVDASGKEYKGCIAELASYWEEDM